MNRKDSEPTPKPSKVEGRYIVCAKCGVVGKTLTKPDKDINRYICLDATECRVRQRLANLCPEKQICSHWFCSMAAQYKCSCGLFLCENHSRSYKYHPGHICQPLNPLKNKNTQKPNDNRHKDEDKGELQVLHL